MKKKNLLISMACIVIVFIASFLLINNNQNKESSENLEEVSIRLKWLDQAQFSGYYVANSKGYYKENGLDVKINSGGPNISPIQMVANGTDDFGITSGNQIILAREQGIPVVAIAVVYQKSPISIVSLKNKNISNPEDLINKVE
ncbi:ABC transporter substrate-binding protein [Patescibacteria group bacterium]|nr:ABC transporter substrate-binding protein [Patescibacteria group bacterium]